MNLLDKLTEQYNIPSHRLKEGQQKTKCPECQPQHDPKDNPLSVDVSYDKILFHCHHCGWQGGVIEDSPSKGWKPKPKTPEPVSYISKPNAFLDTWFKARGISRATYEALEIYTDDNVWINFPYNGHKGKCDAVKSRKADSKEFRQNVNPKKSLYNYKNIKDADTVIFVEGEMDALAVYEVGHHNVTTLQDGAPKEAKYRENDKRFEVLQSNPLKAKKIILFLDQDQAGQSLHLELVHRFGKDRCWKVQLPEGVKDANELLMKNGPLELKKAIDNARPYPVEGLHRANRYHSQVMNLYRGNYEKPINIGYKSLDDIYKVMKGTFHVVTGIPNHGKSTFLDQCLIEIAKNHDWRFAIFSPEHSTKMHIRRLAMIYTGKSFDPNVHGRMTEAELEEAITWIHSHFFFIETKDNIPSISRILDSARGAVQKFGCNGLVIDPYNEVDASRKGSLREDEHIRNFISECKRFCKMQDVTTWVVAHPTKMSKNEQGSYSPPTAYDIAGASHWSNMADAILTIHRDFDTGMIQVMTRKVREQGLYGRIGEATFRFNESKHQFEDSAEDTQSTRRWNGYD